MYNNRYKTGYTTSYMDRQITGIWKTCKRTISFHLQRGTLHESWFRQMEEWSLKSCHIRLQRKHLPLILLLHVAKCLIKPCKPWHVENLEHGFLLCCLTSTSYGPTSVQPSVHICSKHSIASLNCTYNFCSFFILFPLFFLCSPIHLIN